MISEWELAGEYERNWWGTCAGQHVDNEASKQREYAQHMEIPLADMMYRTVLDMGGGPMSIMLQCRNVGPDSLVVDPCFYPAWTVERYNKAGIRVSQIKAEQFKTSTFYNEKWMYNVLQHTEDPVTVLLNLMAIPSFTMRIFEWIDIPIYQGHLHVITKEMLEDTLKVQGKIVTPSFGVGEKAWVYCG